MKNAFYILIIVFLLPFTAFGENTKSEWQNSEKEQIEQGFSNIINATQQKNLKLLIDYMPERFINYFAKKNNFSDDDFKKKMYSILSKGLNDIKTIIVEFDNKDIVYRQTELGFKYAIIPYKKYITEKNDNVTKNEGKTIGFIIDNKVNFIEIDTSKKIDTLKVIFPELKDINTSLN